MENKYDFGGWATKSNIECSDGRTILPNAFKHNNGKKVPLVWNHKHNDVNNVLGHAMLENREDGVYAYCTFNDTETARNAKISVEHGDIVSLSIHANRLKQMGNLVSHGEIREVSLVLAGANPGAYIDSIMTHGEDGDEEAIIYSDSTLEMSHSEESKENNELQKVFKTLNEKQRNVLYYIVGSIDSEDEKVEHTDEKTETEIDGESIKDILDTFNDEQNALLKTAVAIAMSESKKEVTHSEDSGETIFKDITHSMDGEYKNQEQLNNHEGEFKMAKTNVFENATKEKRELTHADGVNIVDLAKSKSVGSLQEAIDIYMEHSVEGEEGEELQHAFEDITTLFPDFKDVRPGMPPEMITRDETWVGQVISKVHKSPISRIRNRYTDARGLDVRAKGYTKGDEKTNIGNLKLISRTTDPQTIYVKDKLHRDDIIDTTDFDYVAYNYGVMQMALNEELAIATMVGDGRQEGDDYKIEETHIRSIWNDDELYTIHKDVDFEAAAAALQGTGTGASFGEGFVQSEAIIEAALYAREGYKGSGSLEFYCTPHLVNVMLLARDMNGRRMYDSKADLAKALNVVAIHEAEQFEGLTRKDDNNKVHELLGLFVNLKDYQYGCTKGGQVTKFRQFDIDFNAEKMLIETRLSGALTRIKSAIALEKDVTPSSATAPATADSVG